MPEMHLKQPRFTYSTCGTFNKNKERIPKFKEKGDSRYIYQNELDKACFQHDVADGGFSDLNKITTADKVLYDKAFNFVKNPKYYGLATKMSNFNGLLIKRSLHLQINLLEVVLLKNEIMLSNELAEELHKSIVRKLERRKVRSSYFGC